MSTVPLIRPSVIKPLRSLIDFQILKSNGATTKFRTNKYLALAMHPNCRTYQRSHYAPKAMLPAI